MGLSIGDEAPDFELRDQHGQPVRLSSFRGRKAVVVMFYPFAFTRVCTGELGEVRDNLAQWESDDVQLLAVSCDPMFSLRAFAEQDGLTFPLLSDFWPHGAVASSYGVLDETDGGGEPLDVHHRPRRYSSLDRPQRQAAGARSVRAAARAVRSGHLSSVPSLRVG